MGLFDWISARRRSGQAPTEEPLALVRSPAFAVLDVETTGLSPRQSRVIEIAIVRVDDRGVVVDEWASRFNPEGPVGATHIHGITDADVLDAPLFRDLANEIAERVAGLPVTAHNAPFDLAFLRAEFDRAGWDMPWVAALCTLEASRHYLPDLDRRRLVDCCWATGVRLEGAHSALGDARATAQLLERYMTGFSRVPALDELASVPAAARTTTWPKGPVRPPTRWVTDLQPADSRPRRFTAARPAEPSLVEQITQVSLLELMEEGAPEGATAYLETLLDALEDGEISADESAQLAELVTVYRMTSSDIAAAHNALMLALAHRAVDDGRVSQDERGQLKELAALLDVPEGHVTAVIRRADAARSARLSAQLTSLPIDWQYGEPLRVGDKVVFTGCDDAQRTELEARAASLGVRISSSVSRLTSLLVTDAQPDDPYPTNKFTEATTIGTRIIHPAVFAILLEHLQPPCISVPAPRSTPGSVKPGGPAASSAVSSGVSPAPAQVRAWAVENGHEVGVRGRLPAEVVAAYIIAMAPSPISSS